MSNCSHASNLSMSPSYSEISGSFSDQSSGLLDTIRGGAKIARIGFWFPIAAITVAIIVAMISELIVGAGSKFRGW